MEGADIFINILLLQYFTCTPLSRNRESIHSHIALLTSKNRTQATWRAYLQWDQFGIEKHTSNLLNKSFCAQFNLDPENTLPLL